MLLRFKLDKDGFRFTNPADLITARSIDYIKCKFEINDDAWASADAIVAVFKSPTYNKHAEILLDSFGCCYIDPEVYKHGGTIQVKLIGDRYLNEEVISSSIVTSVLEFTINESVIIPVTTPSMYAIMLADLEQSKTAVDQLIAEVAYKLAHDGFKGVGIQSISFNLDGTLTITLTDGTSFSSIYSLKGDKGDPGVYIGTEEPTDPDVSVWINPDGGPTMEPLFSLLETLFEEHPEYCVQDNSVTEAKLVNGAVTVNKLANEAVTENKIADEAVTEDKIADGAVTVDKLSDAVKNSPFYDVTKYGIFPDTGEDLYEALFDFLHDVVTSDGGVVYFPQGTYEISDTIFIPPNTVFMGAGPSTKIFFNETYASFGVGLSNGGSNVGIVNMTVDHNNSGQIVPGAITGGIGFSTRTFDSWTTKHQSPSEHASCSNIYAEDLWTNTRYLLQTETHTVDDKGTVTGVTYRNIHAKKSLVSVMGHANNIISDVIIDNVDCAFLRIGVLSNAYSNSNIQITNVKTGRLWLVGDMITISNALLLPDLKYDTFDTQSTIAVIFGKGTIVVRDCYINAGAYVSCFARMSVKLKMFNTIFFGSTQRVGVNVDNVYADETEIVGCSFTTQGTTLTHVEGRMENTYFPSMHYTAKVQPVNIGRERLVANTDLNDLKRAGGRYQCLTENTSTLVNKPTGLSGAFILDIYSQVPTDNVANIYEWYIQRIIPTNCTAIFLRAWTGSDWTAWFKYTGTAV